jgi:hypothetical protein
MGAMGTLAVYIAMTFLRRIVMLSRRPKFGRYPETSWANWTFGTIQRSVVFLLVLSPVHPLRVLAANPALESVLTGSRQRIEELDYRATGRLSRLEGDGKRTSYKFVAKAHWFPDGLRLLCEISGPGSEKTSLLLHMTLSGLVTIEAILPGEKTASVLPFKRWNDPLVGGVHLLRAAAGWRRLVRDASGSKGAGQAWLIDSCNRRGLSKGKTCTQGL